MKYSSYPGCSMSSSGKSYGLSTKYVTQKIGMELVEIDGWNCCGATAAHSTDENLALALPARTLALHEKQNKGMDIAVPCASCYSRLKTTLYEVRRSEKARARIQELIEMPYEANDEVLTFLDIFSREDAMEAIKQNVTTPLNGLRVACYYGCLTVRPVDVANADSAENPMQMDRILSLCGASPVEWAFKTECCGASNQVTLPKESRPLIYRILKNARANGAEAIATACPLCMLNLDMREKEISRSTGENFDLPVYFFTELMAMAMGANAKDVGINKHFYPAVKLVEDAVKKAPAGSSAKRGHEG
jgi:heterodisulfide reductase subunit B